MGIFDIFKKPVTLEDDLFGKLRFRKMKDPEKSYFEGKGIFKPTGNEIDYFIGGLESGPEEDQKELYRWLERDYHHLVGKLIPLIEDEFRNQKDDFKIIDFNKEFTLVGVSIPKQRQTPAAWQMFFDTLHDQNHQITIDLLGQEPQGILVDG